MFFLVKMDYLRDQSWSNFNPDRKHIKSSSTPLFAGNYISGCALNLPPKNQRRREASVGNRRNDGNVGNQNNNDDRHSFNRRRQEEDIHNEPAPLMQNILPNPQHGRSNQPSSTIRRMTLSPQISHISFTICASLLIIINREAETSITTTTIIWFKLQISFLFNFSMSNISATL